MKSIREYLCSNHWKGLDHHIVKASPYSKIRLFQFDENGYAVVLFILLISFLKLEHHLESKGEYDDEKHHCPFAHIS